MKKYKVDSFEYAIELPPYVAANLEVVKAAISIISQEFYSNWIFHRDRDLYAFTSINGFRIKSYLYEEDDYS